MAHTNKTNITNTLLNLGFTLNEIKVYLAGLELGETTVLAISQKTHINRATVYKVISSLQQKSLFITVLHGWKTKFKAQSPEIYLKHLQNQELEFTNTLPELLGLYTNKDRNNIEYYDGVTSTKSLYLKILAELEEGDDYLVISDHQKWLQQDEIFFNKYLRNRNRKSPKIKVVYSQSQAASNALYDSTRVNFDYRVRILNKNTIFTTNIIITPYRIVLHNMNTPISAISITNKDIVNNFMQLFEIIWLSSKEI